MTAFYMWRLCFLTFFGEPRDQHRYEHAHESPRTMTGPLIFLGVLAVGAGWVGLPWFREGFSTFVFHHAPYHMHANYALMLISTLVAGAGIALAYLMYYKKAISPERMAERFRPLYTLLYNKYYFDEIYHTVVLNPILAFARFMWSFDARVVDGAVNGTGWLTIRWSDVKMWFDKWIIDGAVNGSGWIVSQGARALRFLQAGAVQFYVLFAIIAVCVAVVLKYVAFTDPQLGRGWFLLATAVLVVLLTAFGWSMSRKAEAPDRSKQEKQS
jgi:NADH-quinone oxidoreductase subunit L